MLTTIFLYFVLVYHMMLLTNVNYFEELMADVRAKLAEKKEIAYESNWKTLFVGLYLITKGVYFFLILILCLCTLKTAPNIFTCLFALEFIKGFLGKYRYIGIILTALACIAAFASIFHLFL